MLLSVLIAGATGWTGARRVEAVVAAEMELAGGIARRSGVTFSAVDETLVQQAGAPSGTSREVLAIRRVPEVTGVLRGLDRLRFG